MVASCRMATHALQACCYGESAEPYNCQLQGSKGLVDSGGQKQGSQGELVRSCCHSDKLWTVVASCRAGSTCLSDLLLQCHCHGPVSPCLSATITCSKSVVASCSAQSSSCQQGWPSAGRSNIPPWQIVTLQPERWPATSRRCASLAGSLQLDTIGQLQAGQAHTSWLCTHGQWMAL